ncbi:MAG TPA: molybdenum cofactor biosynthesis protein MoaE [Anaerolineales bacterium]|nr:molybdenum cofactor biosynthesis protein MoaE [Anaerolineales bacterium]
MLTLLFFATLKDKANTAQMQYELRGETSVAQLKVALSQQFPALAPHLPTALCAINQEFAFPEDILPATAEVAFFPPVSGGQDDIPTIAIITSDAIDLNALTAAITRPNVGAVCLFSGFVRGQTSRDGHAPQTEYLEYTAYAPMAERKMRQVAEEIRARWQSVLGIAMVQRIGRLEPQTPTVLIACAAAHRDTGVFEAARYGIDRLKEIVPVWKKEVGADGQYWVEGTYQPTRSDPEEGARSAGE